MTLEEVVAAYTGLIRSEVLNLSLEELIEAAIHRRWFDAPSWWKSSRRSAEAAHCWKVAFKKLERSADKLKAELVNERLIGVAEARITELRAKELMRCKACRDTARLVVVAHAMRRQHPVGQGGFHSAEVVVGASRFRYVYDCGSDSKRAVKREIKRLLEGQKATTSSSPGPRPALDSPCASGSTNGKPTLDLLVLSHLHADHVNGVERLLDSHVVERVLLPYLVQEERLVLLASACASDRWSESYHALVQDPIRWFREHDVPDVIFVLPSVENRAADDPPRRPTAGEGRADRRPQWPTRDAGGAPVVGELRLSGMVAPDDHTKDLYPGVDGAPVVPPGEALILSEQCAVWTLIPFTHPEPTLLKEFVDAAEAALRIPNLRTELTSEMGARTLRDALADGRTRSALAKAFRAVRPDQNLSSMSLYAGPALEHDVRCSARFVVHGTGPERGADPGRLGWLATGDAPLARGERAQRFENFYGALLPQVGTFVVPHHGSRKNFKGDLFPSLKPSDWLVAVGERNRHKHPDRALMTALRDRGAERRVTERPGTEFVEVLSVVRDLLAPGAASNVRT